jgi:hypothetical protein
VQADNGTNMFIDRVASYNEQRKDETLFPYKIQQIAALGPGVVTTKDSHGEFHTFADRLKWKTTDAQLLEDCGQNEALTAHDLIVVPGTGYDGSPVRNFKEALARAKEKLQGRAGYCKFHAEPVDIIYTG